MGPNTQGEGRTIHDVWALHRKLIVISLGVLTAVVSIFNFGLARDTFTDYAPSDHSLLADLPLPSHDPHLDLQSRYHLLFIPAPSPATFPPHPSTALPVPHPHLPTQPDPNLPNHPCSPTRLVILPDLHGDASQTLRALLLAVLVHPPDPPATLAPTTPTSPPTSRTPSNNATTAPPHYSGNGGVGGWRWVGGACVCVQLGDVIDRGPDSLELLWVLRGLQRQAVSAGGDVIVLLGNHELMNVQSDLRYVSRMELRNLAEREEQQGGAGGERGSWSKESKDSSTAGERELLGAQEGRTTDSGRTARQLAGHSNQLEKLQRGLELWQAALAPDQPLGLFVRQQPLAALVDAGGCGRTLVVHAGAFPWMLDAVDRLVAGGGGGGDGADGGLTASSSSSELTPEQYVHAWNAVAAEALGGCVGRQCGRHQQGDEGGGGGAGGERESYRRARLGLAGLLLGGEGAVWSRRYLTGPPKQVCAEVAAVAARLGVVRLVVGHTVQRGGRVNRRCGGQLIMADVGISRFIAGEMAVLECTEGNLRVLYGNGKVEKL